MKILFLATNLPIPANNGQAIRSLSVIQAVSSIGHEVSFVSFAYKKRPESLDPLSTYCSEIKLLDGELANISQSANYFKRLRCLASLKTYSLERFRSSNMYSCIQNYLTHGRFDLIVADGLYSIVNIPKTTIPIVLNCHNVEYTIFERYSRTETNLLKKWYAAIEGSLMRAAEQRTCDRVTAAMACSSDDSEILRRLRLDLPTFVVPNTVNTDLFAPANCDNANYRPTLLFQGSMDWYPNRDAVEFFVKTSLPLIREEHPTVKLVIAGRNPPPEFVRKLSISDEIEFTGTIPDIRPWISAATVVIVPLRFGSGTRIKILEACAVGKPVVSTSVGAEGLEFEPGKDIVLADTPETFAGAVIELLNNPSARETIGRSARAVVLDRYSHQVFQESISRVISSLSLAREKAGLSPVGFDSCLESETGQQHVGIPSVQETGMGNADPATKTHPFGVGL